MKRVIIESPYAGNDVEVKVNEIYGEFAIYDCLVNYNETPYASHLLYTRKYVLNDKNPEERKLGIEAGFYWREAAEDTIFYIDLGITNGMSQGIKNCTEKKTPFQVREFSKDLWDKFMKVCKEEGLEISERGE